MEYTERSDFGGFVENFEGCNNNSLLAEKFTCDYFETTYKCSPLLLFYFMLTNPRWWPIVFNQSCGCSKFGAIDEISLCGQEEPKTFLLSWYEQILEFLYMIN